jgi:hypothetical protein
MKIQLHASAALPIDKETSVRIVYETGWTEALIQICLSKNFSVPLRNLTEVIKPIAIDLTDRVVNPAVSKENTILVP